MPLRRQLGGQARPRRHGVKMELTRLINTSIPSSSKELAMRAEECLVLLLPLPIFRVSPPLGLSQLQEPHPRPTTTIITTRQCLLGPTPPRRKCIVASQLPPRSLPKAFSRWRIA